ncbi:MAG: MOSC domain-containing protein [Planctomycetota bacterium]|nr:MAG: MOSC domain-containing protein [Planctomycetota bacterium]
MATTKGTIKAISISKEKGTQKTNVPEAELRVDHGITGDAHAGDWHRQISLLGIESIRKMIDKGARVAPGNFAENITTEGINLYSLPIAAKLRLGESVILEVTQLGKECHSHCAIYEQIGDCIMPREGIFAKVLSPGRIQIADTIEVIDD